MVTQVQQAQDVQAFLQSKFTSAVFYGWMQSEISGLYYQYYRLACDTARQAEQTMKQELMRPELDATQFIQFNYWDQGHQGLLSGEALYLDGSVSSVYAPQLGRTDYWFNMGPIVGVAR